MSFLFKSTKKAGPGSSSSSLPYASRDLRSADGPSPSPAGSQIPLPNGTAAKSGSPTRADSIGNSVQSLERSSSAAARSTDEHNSHVRGDGAHSAGPPSPDQKAPKDAPREIQSQRFPPLQTRQQFDNSPYPWSQRRLAFTASHNIPFPRYGAAVNSTASKDGAIFIMGGLINGSTVKGDLWMVEATPQGSTSCYPVATTSEGPGPRVGHASLLVGNAFIVFGGDTKMDEGDILDDTLYLLNTSTKQWSRALPAGPRPTGRYGHTLNILGSKIYVFGGQVEGYFFNDLVAFDLNALQQPTNRWEMLIQNSSEGGPPAGQVPPARTNHTMVTWGDKMYLFGGTDGVNWFNDVWSYSPHTNSWTMLECIGYIPAPREGHAAALVGDVMYIFGGRTEEGNDLGDLAAFRISSRRWYTFQNMGPSPSPRSGHSMTTVGKQIVVLAGEPSSAPRDPIELGLAYLLDTTKIRYPPDSSNERTQQPQRRPSAGERGLPAPNAPNRGPPPRELMERERSGSNDARIRSPETITTSRLPRAASSHSPASSGPPSTQGPIGAARVNGAPAAARQAPQQQPPNRNTPDRALSPQGDGGERYQRYDSPNTTGFEGTRGPSNSKDLRGAQTVTNGPEMTSEGLGVDQQRKPKPEASQPSRDSGGIAPARSTSRTQSMRPDQPASSQPPVAELPEPVSRARKLSEEVPRMQDSGLGSSPAFNQQHDEIAKELQQAKQKNVWYASELALARKSGYKSRPTDSPVLDESAGDAFNDDDKPLVEALLQMRAELSRVQDAIDEQTRSAAERIAGVEKQRDAAINEAVFAKAKLAGAGSFGDDEAQTDRSHEISRRLATALETQTTLTRRAESLTRSVEAEKAARILAEQTADAAQKRVTELDMYRQQHASELESLRSVLHVSERDAREHAANHAEALAQHQLLTVDNTELSTRLDNALAESQTHGAVLSSLRDAITASTDKAQLLERKLEEERVNRRELETSLRELRTQHDARASDLAAASQQLRDAEELAQKHALEAQTHREAVLAGLGQVTTRSSILTGVNSERVTALQQQVEQANKMVRMNQAAADAASEKLRRAEERIAGLEAYQEQASREGLSTRKQLQTVVKDNHALSADKTDMEQRLERQLLESNALSVQHASLKEILAERGINIAEARKSRTLDSPSGNASHRFSTPDILRMRDLEQQLEASLKSHEDLRAQFDNVTARDDKMKLEYEEKLTALDNDHQAAVKYLRGTERMLSKMKLELQRAKNENGDLRKKLDRAGEGASRSVSAASNIVADDAATSAEHERVRQELLTTQSGLQSTITTLEQRLDSLSTDLHTTQNDLSHHRSQYSASQIDLQNLTSQHAQTRKDFARLQRENSLLELRARDAESKVQVLLDQVESSVDTWRRRSRMSASQSNPNPANKDQPSTHPLKSTRHSRSPSDAAHSFVSASSGDHDPSNTHPSIDIHPEDAHARLDDDLDSLDDQARNSLALDSLASELDALRSHWETTNKSLRLSSHSAGTGRLGVDDGVGPDRERSGADDEHSDVDRMGTPTTPGTIVDSGK